MKTRPSWLLVAAGALLGLLAGWLIASAGAGARAGAALGAGAQAGPAASAAQVIWTCSMHPQIRQDHPGKCPICGMDLVPAGGSASASGAVVLSESAQRIASIEVVPVERRALDHELATVGDRKSTRLNSSHMHESRMPSSA